MADGASPTRLAEVVLPSFKRLAGSNRQAVLANRPVTPPVATEGFLLRFHVKQSEERRPCLLVHVQLEDPIAETQAWRLFSLCAVS